MSDSTPHLIPAQQVTRPVIRAFIEQHRAILERAQAAGTLARTRLDLRDAAEERFSAASSGETTRLLRIFDEEMKAFCSDFRLATVTVQQQIERTVPEPPRTALAIICGLMAAVVTLFIGALVIPTSAALLGFALPVLAFVVVFFLIR